MYICIYIYVYIVSWLVPARSTCGDRKTARAYCGTQHRRPEASPRGQPREHKRRVGNHTQSTGLQASLGRAPRLPSKQSHPWANGRGPGGDPASKGAHRSEHWQATNTSLPAHDQQGVRAAVPQAHAKTE